MGKAVDSLLGEETEKGNAEQSVNGSVKPDYVIKGAFRGNVKEIIETNVWNGKTTTNVYRFNENKQPTEITLNSYNGNKSLQVTCEYNSNGTIKKETFIRITKSDDSSLLGDANELNDISIAEIPFKGGNGMGGLLSSSSNADSETIVYEYTYNDKGDLVSYTRNGDVQPVRNNDNYGYDEYGEDYGESVEKYDTQGRLISSTGDNGNAYYTYNTYGDLTQIKTSDRWWGEAIVAYTAYVYDENRNWTKRILKKTGDTYGKTGVTVSTTRQIHYY